MIKVGVSITMRSAMVFRILTFGRTTIVNITLMIAVVGTVMIVVVIITFVIGAMNPVLHCDACSSSEYRVSTCL